MAIPYVVDPFQAKGFEVDFAHLQYLGHLGHLNSGEGKTPREN
jgi:hypothetical protein